MPHILMIATGGTIACCETERGLSPALDSAALLGALPELSALCTVETLDLMQLDSTDVTAADRQRMAQAVWQNREKFDGFVLTHAFERIDIPSQEEVDKFLPPYSPRQELDPSDPISIGAMVGPEAFTEVRYLAHVKQRQALELIPQVAAEFKEVFGRSSGGLVHTYRCEDADIRIVAMGSCLGTIKDAVDELREESDLKIGVVGVKCFRPFPVEVMGEALEGAKTVVVLERTLAVGSGGVLSRDIMVSLKDPNVARYTVIAGLGGRAITKASLKKMLKDAAAHQLEALTFMDLNKELVERQLERERKTRKSGPVPEALIRDAAMHQ